MSENKNKPRFGLKILDNYPLELEAGSVYAIYCSDVHKLQSFGQTIIYNIAYTQHKVAIFTQEKHFPDWSLAFLARYYNTQLYKLTKETPERIKNRHNTYSKSDACKHIYYINILDIEICKNTIYEYNSKNKPIKVLCFDFSLGELNSRQADFFMKLATMAQELEVAVVVMVKYEDEINLVAPNGMMQYVKVVMILGEYPYTHESYDSGMHPYGLRILENKKDNILELSYNTSFHKFEDTKKNNLLFPNINTTPQDYVDWFVRIDNDTWRSLSRKVKGVKEEDFILQICNHYSKDRVPSEGQLKWLKSMLKEQKLLDEIIYVSEPEPQQEIESEENTQFEEPSSIDDKLVVSLNPTCTFENYITGDHNRMAQEAAVAIANTPTSANAPLLIYGREGFGKTHLLRAIGNKAFLTNTLCKIIYITSEEFTNFYAQYMKAGKMDILRDKVRRVNIFMIDDIQLMEKKEDCQKEFFYICNFLQRDKKQIVLASDMSLKDLPTLATGLKSMLSQDRIIEIQSPSLETRMEIINFKAQQRDISLDPDVAFYLASNSQSNIREMDVQLTKLIIYSQVHKELITQELAEKLFGSIVRKEINMDSIISVVANYYGVEVDEILGSKRTSNISMARQIAMYLCRSLGSFSTTKIGDFFGGKKHTTVMHSVEKIEKDLKVDDKLRKDVEEIKRKI